MSAEEFQARREGYSRVLIDLGTGDGKFVHRSALEHPDTLCIGIDAAVDAMRELSWRSARKPSRGGAANAMFVVAEVERLPPELSGVADRVTVQYPWGSLLRAVVAPDPAVLAGMVRLARLGASLTLRINSSVFEDAAYLERIGMPALDLERVDSELVHAYQAAGIRILERTMLAGEAGMRSSWGQRLTVGSARGTLLIEAVIDRLTGDIDR